MKRFKSIGWIIFSSFSIVFVFLTLSLSYIALKYVERAQKESASNELRVMSFGLTQQVQRYLNRVNSSVKNLSSPGSYLEVELNRFVLRPQKIEVFLKTKLGNLPQFRSLSVYDPDGLCLARTEGPCPKESVEKEPFFSSSGMKRLTYNDIFESPDEEEKVLLISAPITDDNFVLGVLVARVNLATLYDLMGQQLAVSGGAEGFILDSNLRFITPSKHAPDVLAQSHLARTQLINHLNENLWVGEYLNSKDEEVLGTVARIPGHSWYLVVERVSSEIQEQLAKITRIILVASTALLLVLILLTVGISHRITRPIQSLVFSARRVAEGDLSTPIMSETGSSEIAFLASEFEKMRARISASQGRLKERLEISEQKRLQSEKLAAIGTLASSMAHEIRNPLNAMNLLLTQLERTSMAQEKRDEALKQIRGEIIRLDKLVTQILDYAKPIKLRPESSDIREFIRGLLSFYKNVFDEKKIEAESRFNGETFLVQFDQERLRQALVNLIQNAVDAMGSGGRLLVEIDVQKDFFTVSLSDSGSGIEKNLEHRIYDLFFTTKEKGTGLGLSTVKKIVEAHGGQIDVICPPAGGTRVQLALPLNPAV